MGSRKPKKKTFIVLGMHRSATSLIAKGLNSQIKMGNQFLPASPGNPKGYWEDKEFVKLNTDILRKAQTNGSWFNPPSEENILAQADNFSHRIKSLLEMRHKMTDLFGWKDPRTTLTIRLFMPYLVNPHFIVCFRDPDEAAQSLVLRDGCWSHEEARNLVNLYNERLLKFLAEFAKKGQTEWL